MNIELMEQVTKTGKPIWDTLVVIGGGIAFLLQSALSVEIQVWAQIFGGFGLGLFCLTRVYFWIKHNGYEEERP